MDIKKHFTTKLSFVPDLGKKKKKKTIKDPAEISKEET